MATPDEQPKLSPTEQKAQADLRSVEKQFQRDVRITKARPKIRTAFLVVWAVIDIILLVIFLIGVFGYLVAGQFSDRREIASIADNFSAFQVFTQEHSPSSLVLGESDAIGLGGDQFDLYTELQNKNTHWYAMYDYTFETNNESSETFSGFILPMETRPVVALNQTMTESLSGLDLSVENVEWMRVDPHEIDDIETWMDEHDNFVLSNTEYSRDIEIEDSTISRSSFTIENDTPYNYWSATFLVVLMRNNIVAGVNAASVAGFESGESRDVMVNWFDGAPSSVDEVLVFPTINYFDEDVYMDQPGDESGDLRDSF